MAQDLSRRSFLAAAGAVAAASTFGGLVGCSDSDSNDSSREVAPGRGKLPRPGDAPFDTVVVLMMENRSFDHVLGWLPGANGKQAGLSYVDEAGESFETYRLAPDYQGCELQDPFHFWQAMDDALRRRRLRRLPRDATHRRPVPDRLLRRRRPADPGLRSRRATPPSTTTSASMLGPTWPNRLYQLSGTTDLDCTGVFPSGDSPGR